MSKPERIFLLSPARFGGPRTTMLLREAAEFDLSLRLRQGTATLGEVYSFISGLYFRGKLTYATAFGSALVIAPGRGLIPPESLVDADELKRIGNVPVEEDHPPFRDPLLATAQEVLRAAGPRTEFVLLGSIATEKYTGPLLQVLGEQLLFPKEFVGRGDMSRGGLMLRSARSGEELAYVSLRGASLRGRRPPKLERIVSKAARERS
jgi:hypothetical protein